MYSYLRKIIGLVMNYTFLLQLEDTTNWKDFISSNKFPFNSFPKNYFLRCFSSDIFLFSHYPRKTLLILEPKEPKIRRVHWESSVKINREPSPLCSFHQASSEIQIREYNSNERLYHAYILYHLHFYKFISLLQPYLESISNFLIVSNLSR